VYSRKSNEDDASEELRSVARQMERSREYAARKGWVVDEALVFVDDGVSGAEFKRRPGLVRMLNAAEGRRATLVAELGELERSRAPGILQLTPAAEESGKPSSRRSGISWWTPTGR
jgi:DNA invertase Pin-like site-specific DNA recombinase